MILCDTDSGGHVHCSSWCRFMRKILYQVDFRLCRDLMVSFEKWQCEKMGIDVLPGLRSIHGSGSKEIAIWIYNPLNVNPVAFGTGLTQKTTTFTREVEHVTMTHGLK